MTIFLGVDIGSTSIKAAVLDLSQGTIEHLRSRPFPDAIAGQPSHHEVDPLAVVTVTRAVLGELPICPRETSGIVVCSQMGGLLLADQAGHPLSNYLSWRDQRVLEPHPSGDGSFLDQLKKRTTTADMALIGNELKPGSASSLLFWFVETNRLPREPVVAMSLGDFVIASLCETAAQTEATLALGTLNLQTGRIHAEWFERLGCKNVKWPPLVSSTHRVGKVTIGGSQIPCFPAVGDQQAALFGAELSEGELSLNVSTGAQVSVLSHSPRLGDYQTRPYFDGRFLNTITHLPAGRSLNALIELLGALALAEGYILRDPWSTISMAVEQTAETDLDVNLALFAGPLGDRGHVKKMRLENLTIGHLFRAAFEQMADNYARCAERLCPEKNWQQVVLSGGLPQKIPSLRKMISERFNCPIRSVNMSEETLAGLLQLARRITQTSSH